MLYFVQQGKSGPIKIGYTELPMEVRLSSLQVGNPKTLVCLATAEGTTEVEEAVHLRFKSAHIRGEWYKPVEELREFIRVLEKPAPVPEKQGDWTEGLRHMFAKGVSV